MYNIIRSGEYPKILEDVIGNKIEDVLVPIYQGNFAIGVMSDIITSNAYCVVYGGGKRIYLSITVQESDGCDSMIIEAQNSYSIQKYPGGPDYEWGSIANVLGSGEIIISAIDTFHEVNANDNNCHDEDGVILNTEGDRVLCFIPNIVPLWIDFIYSKAVLNTYSLL